MQRGKLETQNYKIILASRSRSDSSLGRRRIDRLVRLHWGCLLGNAAQRCQVSFGELLALGIGMVELSRLMDNELNGLMDA